VGKGTRKSVVDKKWSSQVNLHPENLEKREGSSYMENEKSEITSGLLCWFLGFKLHPEPGQPDSWGFVR
jgi:hypothetical protein